MSTGKKTPIWKVVLWTFSSLFFVGIIGALLDDPHNGQTETLKKIPENTEAPHPIVQQAQHIDRYHPPVIKRGNSERYAKEAETFLTACMADENEIKNCEDEQEEFEQEYINAYSGDYLAQLNVGYYLYKPIYAGVFPNNIQACAWRLVALTSGSPYIRDADTDSTKYICGVLPKVDTQIVAARVAEIKAVVRAHKVRPVPVPAIGYDPKRDRDETTAGD